MIRVTDDIVLDEREIGSVSFAPQAPAART
jgi:hypothetical protein